jgi:ribonuclease BN (tRNA processing enzyme)
MTHRLLRSSSVFAGMLLTSSLVAGVQTQQPLIVTRTRVVLLGTGTPRPLPNRFGPSTAIVVDDAPYLFDFGAGVVRRAAAAFEDGVKGLAVTRLETAFVTHLHSDHTVGYPDLILTPWVMGRNTLRVYGPKGIVEMTEHVLAAWQIDLDIRTKGEAGRQRVTVDAHEIEPGVVYQDANVTVTAFPARHGDVPNAFGYAIKTPDRTIVISGDTSPNPELVAACRKCDILIHEVYASNSAAPMANWLEYRTRHHTSTRELAEIANKTQPGLLVVYHIAQGNPNGLIPDEQVLSEIREVYKGKVVIGRDLDVY